MIFIVIIMIIAVSGVMVVAEGILSGPASHFSVLVFVALGAIRSTRQTTSSVWRECHVV
jgi:hypothetical protein